MLTQTVATSTHCLGVEADEGQWRRGLAVLLDGLRTADLRELPGSPPRDALDTPYR